MVKYLAQLAIVLSTFVTANLLVVPWNTPLVERDTQIDHQPCRRMMHDNADVVLIGNSMLGEGVAKKQLAKSLKTGVTIIQRGGSASAWWYVVTKNVVATCPERPRILVVVFRDTFLTLPRYRTRGEYKFSIDRFAGEHEPVLDKLVYMGGMSNIQKTLCLLLPAYRKREKLKDKTHKLIKSTVGQTLLGKDLFSVNTALDSVLADKNMVDNLVTHAQLKAETVKGNKVTNFDEIAQKSFLSHILQITAENKITLVLMRYKRRRDVVPNRQSPQLVTYIKQLKSYVEKRSAYLIDFTEDSRINRSHYLRGDHLNETGRKLFTEMVAESLRPILQSPKNKPPSH